MLWQAWCWTRSSGRRASERFEVLRKYTPTLGRSLAIALADDLDNAVWEFGTFVEGEMDRKEWDYRNGIAKKNAERKPGKRGRMAKPKEVSITRVREEREKAFAYWVEGRVVDFIAAASASGGGIEQAGVLILEKPAMYDPARDRDMRGAEAQPRKERPDWKP